MFVLKPFFFFHESDVQEIGEVVASSKDGFFRELSVVQHAEGRGESSNAMLYLLLLVLAFLLNLLVDGCVRAERSVPEKRPLNAGAPLNGWKIFR